MKRNKPVCRFIPQREANARQTLAQSEATEMVDSRFQSPDALFKVMAAARTLKFDDVGIDTRHRASFILFFCPSGPVGAAGLPAPSSIFRQESGLSVPRTKHLSGLNEALLLD